MPGERLIPFIPQIFGFIPSFIRPIRIERCIFSQIIIIDSSKDDPITIFSLRRLKRGNLLLMCTHDKENYLVDQTLDALEMELDPSIFFRINRCFIAPINSIKEVSHSFNGKHKIVLQPIPNEQDITVSRDKASQFKSWITS